MSPASTVPPILITPHAAGTHAKVRFAAIDGLRGIACIGVLLFHCWMGFSGSAWPAVHIGTHHFGPSQIFYRGYGGVDLFFVLSGFCLAYPIFSKPKATVNWGKYCVARVRRIAPPYWAALFLLGGISFLIRRNSTLAAASDLNWPGLRSFLADGPLFWKQTVTTSFWTLVLEWRWYFLFPLCIWMCRHTNAWLVLVISIPVSVVSVYVKEGMDRPELINWTGGVTRYLPLFALGLLACELAVTRGRNGFERFLVRNARWGLLLWLLLLFVIPAYPGAPMHRWRGTIHRLSTFGPIGFFATIAGVTDPYVERVLSWRPLVSIGIFSYSLYLVNAPLALAIAYLTRTHLHSQTAILLLYILITPAFVLLVAYLFFLAFERPFLARKPSVRGTAAIPQATAPTAALLPEAAAP